MNAQIEIRKIMHIKFSDLKEKNSSYSLRSFARKLKMSPSEISEILNGKRNISLKKGKHILNELFIDPSESSRILTKIRNKSKIKENKVDETFDELSLDYFKVISDLYYFAILSLAETEDFIDEPEWISGCLNISINESRKAIDILKKINLLEMNKDGKWQASGNQFSTPSDIANMSIRKNHFQSLELAKKSLETDDVDSRDFSGVTMAINPQKIPEAKNMIKEFRRILCDFLEDGDQKEVYRLNVQLFGLSK